MTPADMAPTFLVFEIGGEDVVCAGGEEETVDVECAV